MDNYSFLLNELNLSVYLRSYHGQDLKSHLRICNADSLLDEQDLATLSLHAIMGHDPSAPMKI